MTIDYTTLLRYDPETGDITWKVTKGRAKAGDIAGHIGAGGYREIRVNGLLIYAHRLAYLLQGLDYPIQVDHLNGERDDNRWRNLRSATNAENSRNSTVIRSSTGVKGVYREGSGFKAAVMFRGRNHSKRFKLLEDATTWAINTRNKLHGEFANHGPPVR